MWSNSPPSGVNQRRSARHRNRVVLASGDQLGLPCSLSSGLIDRGRAAVGRYQKNLQVLAFEPAPKSNPLVVGRPIGPPHFDGSTDELSAVTPILIGAPQLLLWIADVRDRLSVGRKRNVDR